MPSPPRSPLRSFPASSACPMRPDRRRAHRRGLRRRPASAARLAPPRLPRSGCGLAATAAGRSIVVCQKGLKLSQGVAAWLRHDGVDAQNAGRRLRGLEGGGQPLVRPTKLPPRDAQGPHRLGHPRAAEGRSHRLPLADPPLRRSRTRCSCSWRLRRCCRSPSGSAPRRSTSTACSGAIAARRAPSTPCSTSSALDASRWCGLRPSCAAPIRRDSIWRRKRRACWRRRSGLSRMYRDDLAQLEAAMALYDAFYRWCRDATEETHNWPSTKASS